jgi:hypothetical protein
MKRFVSIKKIFALLTIVALALVLIAPQAFAGEYWKQTFVRFSATAGETLSIGHVVCIKNADGLVYKADSDSSTLRPAVGVIGKGGASGAVVEIIRSGILAGQTELSEGYRLFLSSTAGAFSTTETANLQGLGFVMPAASGDTGPSKSSIYFIQVDTPLSPGAGY